MSLFSFLPPTLSPVVNPDYSRLWVSRWLGVAFLLCKGGQKFGSGSVFLRRADGDPLVVATLVVGFPFMLIPIPHLPFGGSQALGLSWTFCTFLLEWGEG